MCSFTYDHSIVNQDGSQFSSPQFRVSLLSNHMHLIAITKQALAKTVKPTTTVWMTSALFDDPMARINIDLFRRLKSVIMCT